MIATIDNSTCSAVRDNRRTFVDCNQPKNEFIGDQYVLVLLSQCAS